MRQRTAAFLSAVVALCSTTTFAEPNAAQAKRAPASEQDSGSATLNKKGLTLDGARRAIAAAVTQARAWHTTGVIAVVDDGGNLMALERIDQTFGAGANISIGKARTSALFKKPTRIFEEVIGHGRTSMTALADFTPLQGGFPIRVDGQIVGGIGVSGASSAAQDEQLARAGALALAVTDEDKMALELPHAMHGSTPVMLFSHESVAASFDKGVPIFETDSYRIHASRRESDGMVEVHALETDIAYVQHGTATLVTGGTVENPKTVAPNEIRGEKIKGGETRMLRPGDVVVIPKGTPHWFRNVDAPFTYYVVKVRG